jgi:hypothetical protein
MDAGRRSTSKARLAMVWPRYVTESGAARLPPRPSDDCQKRFPLPAEDPVVDPETAETP